MSSMAAYAPARRSRRLIVKWVNEGKCPKWKVIECTQYDHYSATYSSASADACNSEPELASVCESDPEGTSISGDKHRPSVSCKTIACYPDRKAAIRYAKRHAYSKQSGATIFVHDRTGECIEVHVIRRLRDSWRALQSTRPTRWLMAVLLIVALVFGAILIVVSIVKGDFEVLDTVLERLGMNLQLVTIPIGLLLTSVVVAIGVVAVDHDASWVLRRDVILKALNLVTVALIVLGTAVSYALVKLQSIRFALAGLLIAIAVVAVCAIYSLGFSLYHYALDSHRRL